MSCIQPSLRLSQAAATAWDAVVIGAGCAGAIAARQLALGHARVLLVDKSQFPRYKVCGCCLSRPTQESLDAIGLGDLIQREGGVPTKTFHVAAGGRQVAIPLPEYFVLSRERFDAALIRAATDAGAFFLPGVAASLGSVSDDARAIRLRESEETITVSAKIVLIADGLGSRLLRATDNFDSVPTDSSRIGAGTVSDHAPLLYGPGVIYMACGTNGYVGSSRLEDGRLVIAAAFDAEFVKSRDGLANAARSTLKEAGFPSIPDMETLAWKGTPALTRKPSAVSAHRAFVLGDAAGYVEPFTGEGMKWAVASGVALAPIALQAIAQYDATLETAWATTHHNIVSSRTTVCRVLAASLRSPALVRTAVRALSIAPAIAAPFVRHLNASAETQKEVAL